MKPNLIEQWMSSCGVTTRRNYTNALRKFAIWATSDPSADPEDATKILVEAGHVAARVLVVKWRDEQLKEGLATGTVACHCSAVSSLLGRCRRAGLISWTIDRIAPRVVKRREGAPPKRDTVETLVEFVDHAAASGNAQAVRDAAIIRLLFSCGLRRNEALQVRMEDLDFATNTLATRRKGKKDREPVKLTEKTVDAIRRWLLLRGDSSGWLFFRTERDDASKALTGESVRRLLRVWATRAGIKTTIRPDALRVSAATEARVLARQFLAEVSDV